VRGAAALEHHGWPPGSLHASNVPATPRHKCSRMLQVGELSCAPRQLCRAAYAAGAVLHWLHYLPHYKTLPEPPSTDKDDHLLRRRDTMKDSALQIASYATKPDRKVGATACQC
jgi:hypothetical protein